MTGQEHKVILKASKVARLHQAGLDARTDPEKIQELIPKMHQALEELADAIFDLEQSRMIKI